MGAFVIIAIIAAILAARSAHRSRPPAPMPPKIRIERLPPTIGPPSQRVPWGFNSQIQLQNAPGERPRWSIEWQSTKAGGSTRVQIDATRLRDQAAVDRMIRNANDYLQRTEADRGAIHKSARPAAGWWLQKPVPQP